jgi:hypothetical protein
VAAVATCSGNSTGIPLKAGRTDALAAGPSGVPEPTTSLEDTLAQFEAAGFSQEDAIASTSVYLQLTLMCCPADLVFQCMWPLSWAYSLFQLP